MNHDHHHTDQDSLLAEIRGAGLRATASRVAVLNLLHEAHRPMSHGELVDALADETWDQSTLYRNLMDLAEAGLLRRSEFGDHTWRFEVACGHGHSDHTAHFLCRVCGAIDCLTDLVLTPRPGDRLPKALQTGDIEVQITGCCDGCLSAG